MLSYNVTNCTNLCPFRTFCLSITTLSIYLRLSAYIHSFDVINQRQNALWENIK